MLFLRTVFSSILVISLAFITLVSCKTLPVFAAEKTTSTTTPRFAIQLENSQGVLSNTESKQILKNLKNPKQDTNIFTHHLALEDSVADSPLVAGNKVVLLQDGPATYQAMLSAIKAAKDHINMETYIFEADDVGKLFAQALIEKQKAGVQVNLIYDDVGSLYTSDDFFKDLSDHGIKVLEFNPINPTELRKDFEWNQRNHRKLLIVDGHTAFLGGINISSVYSGSSFKRASRTKNNNNKTAWRDTDVQIQGPVVAEFQKLFLTAWKKQHGAPLSQKNYFPPLENVGDEVVRAIGSSPEEPYSLIYATLISAIDNAKTTIYIANAYFIPDPQLLLRLQTAARRGVDVRLILPSKTDSWLAFHAGRSYYTKLLQAGVKIYELQDVVLHSKTVLIDGVWTTIGSTNLDWRSFVHNFELTAVILGADFGAQTQKMFMKDLRYSKEVLLKEWQNRPIHSRIKEYFASIWAYWL
ncbi:MAG: cardiolipin synthase [Gammaproteobacteria bacterium]|nr:cardiolipin synthase [Gammaproteobacteria bacterium]